MKTIKLGTRRSALALWQAHTVKESLESNGFPVEIFPITTKGDKILNISLSKIGAKGIFTQEIEEQLARGKIDIAVHSAKDMPSQLPHGFELIAFGKREQAGDVLIGTKKIDIEQLMYNKNYPLIKVGTSSTRRMALIKKYFPSAVIVPMRGNLQTRIRKLQLGICDYLMLAHAGIIRQNLQKMIMLQLPLDTFVPPAGQGSVTIEVHQSFDQQTKEKISKIFDDRYTSSCIFAERIFLNYFQGGCSIPIFVYAKHEKNAEINMTAGIISLDGKNMVKKTISIAQHQSIADETKKLATYISNHGGADILKKIRATIQ